MITPALLEQLEAERAATQDRLDRLDDAITSLRALAPAVPNGRPAKKAARATGRGKQSTKHLDGKRSGRTPAWDTEKARQLYDRGRTFPEIAEAVGATAKSVGGYARRHRWPPRGKGFHRAKGSPVHRKTCRGCGSTVGPERDSCPSCGMPA